MGNAPDDSRIQRVDPTRVAPAKIDKPRLSKVNGSTILDNLLEDIGIGGREGGSA